MGHARVEPKDPPIERRRTRERRDRTGARRGSRPIVGLGRGIGDRSSTGTVGPGRMGRPPTAAADGSIRRATHTRTLHRHGTSAERTMRSLRRVSWAWKDRWKDQDVPRAMWFAGGDGSTHPRKAEGKGFRQRRRRGTWDRLVPRLLPHASLHTSMRSLRGGNAASETLSMASKRTARSRKERPFKLTLGQMRGTSKTIVAGDAC